MSDAKAPCADQQREQHAAATSPAGVVDVTLTSNLLLEYAVALAMIAIMSATVGVILIAALLFGCDLLSAGVIGVKALLAMVATVIGALVWRALRAARRARSLPLAPQDDAAACVAQLRDAAYRTMAAANHQDRFLRLASERLLDAGHVGVALRVDRPRPLETAIEPFGEWFEPTPLSRMAGNKAAATSRRLRPSTEQTPQPPPRGVTREQLAMLPSLASTAVCAMLFLWIWNTAGFMAASGVLAAVALPIVVNAIILTQSGAGRRRWFVVPGGVVVRESSPFSSRVTLDYFTRQDSVLAVGENQTFAVVVRRDGGSARRRLTPEDARTLLRAWISPHPPPTPSQLSDLQ